MRPPHRIDVRELIDDAAYCLSYTATLFTGCPVALTPLVVTFPRLAVSRHHRLLSGRDFTGLLRHRLHGVGVDARARDRVGVGVVPGDRDVLAVVVCVNSPCLVVPSAATWSTLTFAPAPTASIFVVPLFGAGPGLYFDFAMFSFHTPTCGSLCANAAPVSKANTPRHATDGTT